MEPLVEYVERVDVWAATIEDKPGGLARVLAELREEGADLQFIISRRQNPAKESCSSRRCGVTGKSLRQHRWVLTLRLPSIPFESWARIGRASPRR